MWKFFLAAFAVFFLTGCAGVFDDPDEDAKAGLAIACNKYALALESAVPFAATMTPEQKDGFKTAISVVGPICIDGLSHDEGYDWESALAQVNTMLARMIVMQQQLEAAQ